MNNYIVKHIFKSEDARSQCLALMDSMSPADMAAALTGENAVCKMNWNDGVASMNMYCWWQATDGKSVISQLGQLNDFFTSEPIKMDNVTDIQAG